MSALTRFAGSFLLLAGLVPLGVARAGQGLAGGNLLVTPTRVTLEGRTRTAEVILHNTGSAPASYRISMINLEMNEDGRTSEKTGEATDPGAKGLVRFSPPQVLLAPGASQVVRIQLRKPDSLAPGDHISHLQFRAIPGPAPAIEASAGQISMNLRAVFGLSIPVIVRHGATAVTGGIAGLRLLDPEQRFPLRIGFDLLRQGNRSLYGDLLFSWQPKEGAPVPAGRMNGVAVYPNLARRKLQMRLDLAEAQARAPGTLKVVLVEPGTAKPLAEGTLALP
jgi:P pilus assembly chaperone PapD